VPTAATVKLGDGRLFNALQEFTKPSIRVEHVRMADGAVGSAALPGALPVTLLQRQALGPFDVSTLAATNASALGDWLAANGYQFPEALGTALKPYVDQHWLYVAVRLTPGKAGEALTGALDPLQVTFQSDRIIYPMRLSALARNPLPVFLYVLAEHRADNPAGGVDAPRLRVQFAGWVDPAALPPDSPIAPLVPHRLFLTKFYAQLNDPASIKDDWVFPLALNDEPYRDVEVQYVYDAVSPFERLFLPAAIVVVVAALVLGIVVVRRRRAPGA
jgi:hypothetical protein